MPKYQIIISHGDSSKSYEYFEAKEKPEEIAATKATEYIKRRKELSTFFSPFKAPRTLNVVEYDTEKKSAKKGGYKFKLELFYFQATMNTGRKVRQEWYEPKI
jgi:hypothetical protein